MHGSNVFSVAGERKWNGEKARGEKGNSSDTDASSAIALTRQLCRAEHDSIYAVYSRVEG